MSINGREYRVKAGEPLDINLPMKGTPAPVVTWLRDGNAVIASPSHQVEADETHTRLFIPSSRRSDAGPYVIKAVNDHGSAEANIKVTVIDKPGEPQGPLEYPKTTKNSVSLKWKPPKDDGGSDVIGYVIEYCEVGSTKWHKCPDYVGQPNFTVRDLEDGHQYIFRVRAENLVGVGDPLTGMPVTAKDMFDTPGPPGAPEITGYNTTSVSLKWTPPKDDGGSPVTGYVIEKFEKDGADWTPVNTFPITACENTVTGLFNGQTYQFRVKAVNEAGPGRPSKSSEPITCRPPLEPPGSPEGLRVGKVTKNSAELTWMRPISDGGGPILGYIVEKKRWEEAEWQDCNMKPIKDTRFVVPNLPENAQYEFRVRAVNAAGPGEPCKPTEPVTIQDQPGRPCIDVSQVKDITVRAGQEFTIRIPFTGAPKPIASFINDNKEIFEDGDRVR